MKSKDKVSGTSTSFQTGLSSFVQSHPQRVPDHVLLCYKRRHSPGNGVLQSNQTSQVVLKGRVVPGTGPEQLQYRPPAQLPGVDEQRVGRQTYMQRLTSSQEPRSQPLHQVDCSCVHGQSPQAAVTCQPPVPGAAPVPHSSEGHLTQAAVKGVHVESY